MGKKGGKGKGKGRAISEGFSASHLRVREPPRTPDAAHARLTRPRAPKTKTLTTGERASRTQSDGPFVDRDRCRLGQFLMAAREWMIPGQPVGCCIMDTHNATTNRPILRGTNIKPPSMLPLCCQAQVLTAAEGCRHLSQSILVSQGWRRLGTDVPMLPAQVRTAAEELSSSPPVHLQVACSRHKSGLRQKGATCNSLSVEPYQRMR